jgi:hypothetical protein
VRSFIASASTSDPLFREFRGDNRGTTTAENVTARGRAQIHYDVSTRNAEVVGKPYADPTERSNWGFSTSEATGKVSYRTNQFDNGSNKVIDLLYSTYNPLTPKSATPAVDVKARVVVGYDNKNGVLNVSFTVYADGYPSTEAFIEDANNYRVFLGAKPEEGSPASKLNGGPELLRFTGNIKINLDKNNNFTSVTVGSGEKAVNYSIEDWNRSVETKFENEKEKK